MNIEYRILNRIKNKTIFFIALCIILYLLFFIPVSAFAWVPGEPLVPCGGVDQVECTKCELLHLLDNLIDFIMIAAAPILATVFFVVAGIYIMLGGANPGMLANGKRIFSSTFVGILIVMLSWLITNTLIITLLEPSQALGNIPFNSADWWRLQCGTLGF